MKNYRSRKAGENIVKTYDALLAAWEVDFEERDIASRYGKTHVIIAGDSALPPLVLFHGVGDDAALMWVYNAAYLAKKFRIYAVDTIGGPGKSDMGPGYDSEFDDVVWIDETLDGLKLDEVNIAGVSHGGYLAQLYTLKRPERVRRAIAISSSVPVNTGSSPMKTMMKIFMPEALFPTDGNVIKLLKKLSGDNFRAFTENPLILEHYKWLLKGFNNMAMGYHKVRGFTDEEIDSIRAKTYYLAGEADPFQKLGGRKALDEHRMRAKFYPGAGHGLNHELAEEINSEICEILG